MIYLTTDDQYSETISADAAFVFVLPTKLAEEPQSASYQQLCRKLADLLVRVGSSDELRREALVAAGDWSHFLSLTYANIDDALPHLPELTVGVDALELRVDLLDDLSVASVHRQIAVLRSACDLPIVFTVRSKNQIGRFPDDAPDHMFKLLGEGLRASVDWLDVEGCWPESYVKPLCVRAREQYSSTSCLLGSLHVTVPQTEDQIRGLFQTASLYGQADILKVVTGAKDDDDCKRIHKVGEQLDKPYIGVCLGAAGSLSRVLNRRFTPVTHPRMAAAAPGQLSVQQLMDQRQQLGLIKSKQFFLFGTPIQQSLSPAMHNGAFKQLLLPHTYALDEQQDIKSYESTLFSDNFGGASVTIPHKESILPYLSEVKSPADIIGAVNTIIVEETIATSTDKNSPNPASRRLVGYNTDWLGILVPVRRKLEMLWGADGWVSTDATGLVVGAGGTAKAACYAVQKLGLKLLVTNRDEEKGKDLANRYV